MIELKKLAEGIESSLNAISKSNIFKIYADMGDFQEYARNVNDYKKYINGVLESLAPSILPIKSLQAITQTIRLSLILDVEMLGKDEDGNYIEVEDIRAVLEQFMGANNGVPSALIDSLGVTFEITPAYSGVTVGEVALLSPIGKCLPIYLDGTYTIIESGVNSNGVTFSLNGQPMFAQAYTMTRVRTAEANTFSDEKNSKTFIQTNGLSVNIRTPFLSNQIGELIEDDILDGGNNKAQWLQYKRGQKERNYIVVFGTNEASGEMGKNIGLSVPMVEGRPELLEYSEYWRTQEVVATAGIPVSIGELTPGLIGVCWWGDGTNSSSDDGIFSHTYSESGTYEIRIFSSLRQNKVTFYEIRDGVKYFYYEETVVSGETVKLPSTPVSEGYEFDGWYYDEEFTEQLNLETPVTSDLNIYGKMSNEQTYTISYYSSPEDAMFSYNTRNPIKYKPSQLPLPLYNAIPNDGYYFEKWLDQSGNEKTIIERGTRGDIEIEGVFGTYRTYNINYDILVGTDGKTHGTNNEDNPTSYREDKLPVKLLEGVPDEGYRFAGWYNEHQNNVKINAIPVGTTGTVSVYGIFADTTQKIITYGNIASEYQINQQVLFTESDLPLELEAPVLIPGKVRSHIFKGWYYFKDGEKTSITQITEWEDITIYAEWE